MFVGLKKFGPLSLSFGLLGKIRKSSELVASHRRFAYIASQVTTPNLAKVRKVNGAKHLPTRAMPVSFEFANFKSTRRIKEARIKNIVQCTIPTNKLVAIAIDCRHSEHSALYYSLSFTVMKADQTVPRMQ